MIERCRLRAFVSALLLASSGCMIATTRTGTPLDNKALAGIEIRKATKGDVLDLLGEPTLDRVTLDEEVLSYRWASQSRFVLGMALPSDTDLPDRSPAQGYSSPPASPSQDSSQKADGLRVMRVQFFSIQFLSSSSCTVEVVLDDRGIVKDVRRVLWGGRP